MANLPPESLILWQFATGIVDTVRKFAAGINLTLVKLVAKFASGVVDTGGAPGLANISANFQKNLKWPNGILWGWGETDS